VEGFEVEMAKKKSSARRVPKASTPRTFAGSSSGAPATPAPVATRNGLAANGHAQPAAVTLRKPAAASRPAETRSMVPLAEEYHYVVADLKRLGILAAGTFGVLIVLGLIIR
jgi:hypothetical protein